MKTIKVILGVGLVAMALPVYPATITITFSNPDCEAYVTSYDGRSIICIPKSVPRAPNEPEIINCPGFNSTRVLDVIIPKPGTVNNAFKTSNFGQRDAFVFRFKAPDVEDKFAVSIVPAGGSASSFHSYSLASKPCVFNSVDPSIVKADTQTLTSFTVNMKTGKGKGELIPGETYYLNVSHRINTNEWACGKEQCNLLFTFTNAQ